MAGNEKASCVCQHDIRHQYNRTNIKFVNDIRSLISISVLALP
jgi:hypothetical protein